MSSSPQTLVASGDVTGGAATPASAGIPQHQHHHPHLPHFPGSRRLRHFLKPDGRKVHIAGSPDEAEELRRTLSVSEKGGDFDLVIHGSPEHIEALRHTHAHHEDRHRKFREEHGDLIDEFERLIRELDSLSSELHMCSDHAVQLDANFSKYGYSAHIRTKDSPDNTPGTSLYGDAASGSFDKDRWAAERKLGETMRFYQKPIIRQYFHKGLLWRAREAQEVASYELFIDLFYVGIIAATGDHAAEDANGEALLHFVITFTMGWKIWSDIAVLISWFDSDDILRRISVMFILTCLLGFTTNINDAFSSTYTPLVSFYLASRFYVAVSLFYNAFAIPMVRGAMIGTGILCVVPAAFWIASIHVEEPGQLGLIWPALFLDIFGQSIMVLLQRPPSWMKEAFHAWSKRTFEFFPATNIEHRIERTGQFVTLVFGSCVLGLLYQSSADFGINAFFGKAVLGLIQAFTFNWLYFEIDSFNLHTHAIRRNVQYAMIWFTVHLPFIMAFVLSSSALAVLVRAHDSPDSPLDSLYATYIPRSEEHITPGLRWFYTGGLGASLFCMSAIGFSHQHKKIPHQRMKKHFRLLFRFVISIIIVCLGATHLNSLELVGTTTGLIVAVLVLEIVGATCTGENPLWDERCRRDRATYSARCNRLKRKELERAALEGKVLDVEEIAKREGGGESGVVGMV